MMRLSELKALLPTIHNIQLRLESGAFVPEHFHITEVGLIEKHFIDCGGTVRREQRLSLQLWHANDHEHRLHPMKLLNIIRISEQKIHIGDVPIEVEYQGETIGKYDLEFKGRNFILVSKKTNCLAGEQCGTPSVSPKMNIGDIHASSSCCTPGDHSCR